MKKSVGVLIALSCFLLVGCGPFLAGTWIDDPKNWKRAFEEAGPPNGIEVVHSWYSRSPHFTAEYNWFFELTLSAEVKKEIISNPDLVSLATIPADEIDSKIAGERPKWFAPQPLTNFDVYESRSQRNFIFFIEKKGQRSFWTRCQ